MATTDPEFSQPEVIYPPVAETGGPSRAMVAAPPTPAFGMGPFAARGPDLINCGFHQTWRLNCLRRRWMLASLMGLLIGGAAAGLLMWLVPESSRITSYLEVKADDANAVFDTKGQRQISSAEATRQAQNHLALIKS